jgi:hypothetical protein
VAREAVAPIVSRSSRVVAENFIVGVFFLVGAGVGKKEGVKRWARGRGRRRNQM